MPLSSIKTSIGFNQIKGRDLFGKFEENDLRYVTIIGNAEVIHFVRDEEKALIGIEKTSCSEIYYLYCEMAKLNLQNLLLLRME